MAKKVPQLAARDRSLARKSVGRRISTPGRNLAKGARKNPENLGEKLSIQLVICLKGGQDGLKNVVIPCDADEKKTEEKGGAWTTPPGLLRNEGDSLAYASLKNRGEPKP